jgi:hypothetical protein
MEQKQKPSDPQPQPDAKAAVQVPTIASCGGSSREVRIFLPSNHNEAIFGVYLTTDHAEPFVNAINKAAQELAASALADAGRELEKVKVLLRKANPYVKCHRHWGKDNRCTLCEIENDVMNFLSLPTPEGQIMTTTNQKIIEEIERLQRLDEANDYHKSTGYSEKEAREIAFACKKILLEGDTIVAALRALDALPKTQQSLRLARRALLFVKKSNVPSEVRTLAMNVAESVREVAGIETHLPGCAFDSNHPDESTGSCIPGCPIGEASAMAAYFAGPQGIAALATLSHDNRQGAGGGKV